MRHQCVRRNKQKRGHTGTGTQAELLRSCKMPADGVTAGKSPAGRQQRVNNRTTITPGSRAAKCGWNAAEEATETLRMRHNNGYHRFPAQQPSMAATARACRRRTSRSTRKSHSGITCRNVGAHMRYVQCLGNVNNAHSQMAALMLVQTANTIRPVCKGSVSQHNQCFMREYHEIAAAFSALRHPTTFNSV